MACYLRLGGYVGLVLGAQGSFDIKYAPHSIAGIESHSRGCLV